MLFDNWSGIVRVLAVSVFAYALLIAVLRTAGKRSLAKLNAFDLVVTVALGSTLATVLLSKDIPFVEGALAFVMLATLQYAVAKASVHVPWIRHLVRSKPRLLFEDGRFDLKAMEEERVTQGELVASIRRHGIGRLEEVAAVVLETDGSFSVIRSSGEGPYSALRSVEGTPQTQVERE